MLVWSYCAVCWCGLIVLCVRVVFEWTREDGSCAFRREDRTSTLDANKRPYRGCANPSPNKACSLARSLSFYFSLSLSLSFFLLCVFLFLLVSNALLFVAFVLSCLSRPAQAHLLLATRLPLRITACTAGEIEPGVAERPSHCALTRSSLVCRVGASDGGFASNVIRKLVSKKKIRFQRDGFDLDLAYITRRVIAMGLPAWGTDALYRNRREDVRHTHTQDSH